MRVGLCALVVATGCRQILGLDQLAPHDTAPPPPLDTGPQCMTGKLHEVCATSPPLSITLTGGASSAAVITDTPNDAWIDAKCLPAYTDACVIAANEIVVNNIVGARGTFPLILAAFDTITVNGEIDVSSLMTPGDGAGSVGNNCMKGMPAVSSGMAGGGGAGGSFGASGGNGGDGGGGSASGGRPGPSTSGPLSAVRGGCPGENGAVAMGALGNSGGSPGGGVYLLARNAITVTNSGQIRACGAGGRGGPSGDGGGGGGSGGLIALEAPVITIDGNVLANGGGGATGGASAPGGDGQPACLASPPGPAPGGGSGVTAGGAGGTGSFGASGANGANGGGVAPPGGGGGGGGGAGYILIASPTQSTGPGVVISPAAQPN